MEDQMREVVDQAKASFKAGKLKSYEQRCNYLLQIDKFLKEQEQAIRAAQKADVGKTHAEVTISEIMVSRAEVTHCLDMMKSWMSPQKVSKPLTFIGDKTYIQSQPYGVVLLIVPWNYPFYLLFSPLCGAIAAGNCVVIKPSEVSVESEKLVRENLNKYLPRDCFPVVCGGPKETTALLKQRFDYIFFTGATSIGRIVMKAAAEHITPVTLELGGKSPTFIHESSDLQCVANRIIANKAQNAGQACISFDYLLCTKEIQDKLVVAMVKSIETFFGDMQSSESYGRIINERHFDRLVRIKTNTKGTIAIDCGLDKSELFMGLTVVTDVRDDDDAVLQEEIFGPILAIVPVSGLQAAIDFINEREKPLAAYVFSKDKSVIREFEENTSSGAMVANDSIMNMTVSTLPFGGVGESGIGAYHGKFTFDTFSHKRAIMHRKQAMEAVNMKMRYPPFSEATTRRLTSLLFKTQDSTNFVSFQGIGMVLLGLVVVVGALLYRQ
ncbi:aldehyde dehydrogenase family 3 member B1-like [Sycon ciliatum]|uniref:aldehyde dehydrogenase family 3 member B1-like n=1 Tax=Sycon ciliatum TaxID=27933 RepID=UPI0020AAF258|eukprot:scpid57507/ scgid28731/ Aldehyde dehydrogenase family 3 member B1